MKTSCFFVGAPQGLRLERVGFVQIRSLRVGPVCLLHKHTRPTHYYYYVCHPTMWSMSLNVDRPDIQKEAEEKGNQNKVNFRSKSNSVCTYFQPNIDKTVEDPRCTDTQDKKKQHCREEKTDTMHWAGA